MDGYTWLNSVPAGGFIVMGLLVEIDSMGYPDEKTNLIQEPSSERTFRMLYFSFGAERNWENNLATYNRGARATL